MHDVCRGKDCMKKFCESLRDYAMKIISFKKKKKKKFNNHMKMQKSVIYKKNLKINMGKIKKIRDHCHYTGEYGDATHSIYNLKYNVPQKIPISYHNRSNYDYHFIIKELAEEFEKQFTCLGENTENT